MIDFTNCNEIINKYKGSEKKKTLLYNNTKYLVKFPDPVREKSKQISYINNAFSEYIGSNIFKICGFEAQTTILGLYKYNGKDKIVCACKDFTDDENELYEFESFALSVNPDKKIETDIDDIINVLKESCNLIDTNDTIKRFWEMFIIDCLIGNTDRHNGNWGFVVEVKNGRVKYAPIYDCGSCLNPLLTDEEIEKLTMTEIKNLALNSYSCIRYEGRKINYKDFIIKHKMKECNEALNRILPRIKIDEIINFINSTEALAMARKEFYKNIIKIRYENILKLG